MPIPWNKEGDGADAALHFACDDAKCSAIRTDGGGYSAMDAAAALSLPHVRKDTLRERL